MAASDEARRFLHKAAQVEYVLARLSDDPAAPDEPWGFHAQQAVEKLLKPALFLAGGEPPRTHHLAQLEALLGDGRNSLENARPAWLRSARETHMTTPCQPAGTDRWFLMQMKESVDFQEELAGARN